jgi:hypothetical protein
MMFTYPTSSLGQVVLRALPIAILLLLLSALIAPRAWSETHGTSVRDNGTAARAAAPLCLGLSATIVGTAGADVLTGTTGRT